MAINSLARRSPVTNLLLYVVQVIFENHKWCSVENIIGSRKRDRAGFWPPRKATRLAPCKKVSELNVSDNNLPIYAEDVIGVSPDRRVLKEESCRNHGGVFISLTSSGC